MMLLAGSEWWPFLRATEPQNSLNGGQTLSSNPLSCHFIPPQVRCIKYKCLHDILSPQVRYIKYKFPCHFIPPQVRCIKYKCFHDIFSPLDI